MAVFDNYYNVLIKHEGGYVDHKNDPGGATNLGITLATWRAYGKDLNGDKKIDKEDVKLITKVHAAPVYKRAYWDTLSLDAFNSQSLAEIVFDHGVNAGVSRAAKMLQYLLGVTVDGQIGAKTLAALHNVPQKALFEDYKALRRDYYNYRASLLNKTNPNIPLFRELGVSPSLKARDFIKGWLNRVDSFKFKA